MTIRPEDLSGDARRRYDTWRGPGLSEAAAIGEFAHDGLLPDGQVSGDPEEERLRAAFVGLGLTESQAPWPSRAAIGPGGSRPARRSRGPRGGITDLVELDQMFEDAWVDLGYPRPLVQEARRRWRASLLSEGYAKRAEQHRAAAAAPAKGKAGTSAASAKRRLTIAESGRRRFEQWDPRLPKFRSR